MMKFMSGYFIGALIAFIMMAIFKPNKVERDQYGNDIKLTKEKVIMGDTNVLTVEELIEVYHELNY